MDFVIGLPQTQKGNDSILVIIDRLTKVAHFIPVKNTFGGATLARIYLKEIVRLHGFPQNIVLDRGTQFTSKFWMSHQQAMGTNLDFSTAYHPQSDGQTERVNKVLKDLLRACVLTFDKNWESSLSYAGFSSPPVTSPALPADHTLSLSLTAITPAPVKLGTAPAPSSLCSHPFTTACPSGLVPGAVHPHRRRCVPRRHQMDFGRFPPQAPIKRTARAPPFLTVNNHMLALAIYTSSSTQHQHHWKDDDYYL
jgi:hypothetical protein